MKKNFWLILGATVSLNVMADQPTTTPRPAEHANSIVDAQTNAPTRGARSGARRSSTRPAPRRPVVTELRTVPLVSGPAVVNVGAGPVDVRGRAGLAGEVIARVTNGEPVMVIEEVELKNSKADEPSAWAKIVLPEKAHAWVKSSYIDLNHTVNAKSKLNIRGGPGENYSVIGSLQPGDVVKELQTRNGWTEIETTTNAYAFMAAQYLKQGPAELAMITTPPATTTTVADTTTVTPATNDIAMPTPTPVISEPTPVITEPP